MKLIHLNKITHVDVWVSFWPVFWPNWGIVLDLVPGKKWGWDRISGNRRFRGFAKNVGPDQVFDFRPNSRNSTYPSSWTEPGKSQPTRINLGSVFSQNLGPKKTIPSIASTTQSKRCSDSEQKVIPFFLMRNNPVSLNPARRTNLSHTRFERHCRHIHFRNQTCHMTTTQSSDAKKHTNRNGSEQILWSMKKS